MVVAGLSGFAISQPLLGIIGDEPATVAFYGIRGAELVMFAATIALVPPLVLWAASAVLQRLHATAGRALHLVSVAALAGLALVQVAKAIGLAPAVAGIVAGAGGVTFMLAYSRRAAIAAWASYTAILPVLALGAFLFTSPTSALLDAGATAPTAQGGDAPSVVMIVLDELPTRSLLDAEGGIDATRFPSFAAFAGDATWYRHHTSQASYTQSAVPSMLTGRVPALDEPLFTSYPENLFTLLAPTHELEVLEAATRLCPYEQCVPTGVSTAILPPAPGLGDLVGVARDLWFDRVRPGDQQRSTLDDFAEQPVEPEPPTLDAAQPEIEGQRGFEVTDDEMRTTSARAEALGSAFDAAKGASLYYLHLLLPHQPWRYQADGALYNDTNPVGLGLPQVDVEHFFSWSPWVGSVAEQRHLLQLQYTDQVLGRLLRQLDDAGLYDSSLVVVTSDHGVSFEEDQVNRGVTDTTIDAIAYAPLLVKAPHQDEGVVDDSNLMAVDLLPTIAAALDVEVPWEVDGAPAGSQAIVDRGTAKVVYDIVGLGNPRLERTIEYDDAEVFPTVGDRWIGPLPDPDDPFSALQERLGLRDVIGTAFPDLGAGRDPSLSPVTIAGLGSLRQLPPDDAPFAVLDGLLEGGPPSGRVVLALNGTIVAGSELSTDADGQAGRLLFLLPLDVLEERNEVQAALLVDGEAFELELEGG